MADTVYVVDKGLDLTCNLLLTSNIKYVGWGTGTNAATATDTGLQTASGDESRSTGTQTLQLTSTANDTYQVVATITCATNNKAITEVGIFDSSTTGNMYLRAGFSAINVTVGDSIQFTLKAQYNQA